MVKDGSSAFRFPFRLTQNNSTTLNLWYRLATAHDYERHTSSQGFYEAVFSSHLAQLAIVCFWVASHLFHVGSLGQFENFVQTHSSLTAAHLIRDPHFGSSAVQAFSTGAGFLSVVSTSGLYSWYNTVGITTDTQCLRAASYILVLGSGLLAAAIFHIRTGVTNGFSWKSLLRHHFTGLLGTGSLAWAGHIIHVAIPVSRHSDYNVLTQVPHPLSLAPFFDFNWSLYAANPDSVNHLFGQADAGAGTAILTFIGQKMPLSGNLYLTDIAHHHLAIGIVFIVLGSLIDNIAGQSTLDVPYQSLHYQLAISLAILGTASSLTAQHMDALPPYAFLDNLSQAALYTHHQYIGGLFVCGGFAHGAIYLVRDDSSRYGITLDALSRWMLEHRQLIISHLSYVSLFLGFHTLGLYVHNDVMQATGAPEKLIAISPVFAQWIQVAHGNNLGYNLSSGDILVHHGIALGLHVSVLILLKAALNARSSKLFPDKDAFGYGFPCDGPGRGGTCDISAWDGFYLATFWVLNTIGWVTFYWHWRHIAQWTNNPSIFHDSSTYLMGWFRDYLWFNSSQLINGYNPFGVNSLSVWAWTFLLGHLIWAIGFMFLISWRGYWQELIESIVWAHEQTPIANRLIWNDKPVALSIVQARLVGLAHFAVGYVFTYGPFVIGATIPL